MNPSPSFSASSDDNPGTAGFRHHRNVNKSTPKFGEGKNVGIGTSRFTTDDELIGVQGVQPSISLNHKNRMCSTCQIRPARWLVEWISDQYAVYPSLSNKSNDIIITSIVTLRVQKCWKCVTEQETKWIKQIYATERRKNIATHRRN